MLLVASALADEIPPEWRGAYVERDFLGHVLAGVAPDAPSARFVLGVDRVRFAAPGGPEIVLPLLAARPDGRGLAVEVAGLGAPRRLVLADALDARTLADGATTYVRVFDVAPALDPLSAGALWTSAALGAGFVASDGPALLDPIGVFPAASLVAPTVDPWLAGELWTRAGPTPLAVHPHADGTATWFVGPRGAAIGWEVTPRADGLDLAARSPAGDDAPPALTGERARWRKAAEPPWVVLAREVTLRASPHPAATPIGALPHGAPAAAWARTGWRAEEGEWLLVHARGAVGWVPAHWLGRRVRPLEQGGVLYEIGPKLTDRRTWLATDRCVVGGEATLAPGGRPPGVPPTAALLAHLDGDRIPDVVCVYGGGRTRRLCTFLATHRGFWDVGCFDAPGDGLPAVERVARGRDWGVSVGGRTWWFEERDAAFRSGWDAAPPEPRRRPALRVTRRGAGLIGLVAALSVLALWVGGALRR